MQKIILGIDPGKTGGYCFVRKGEVFSAGSVNTQNFESITNVLNFAHVPNSKIVCYIEDAYLHVAKLNPKTLLMHAKSIGYIGGIYESHGVKCKLAIPKSWQSEMLAVNGRSAKNTKAAAINIAASYGIKTKNHNIADAVCIAMYGYNQERLKDAVH